MKDLKIDDNGEGLSVSRGGSGCKGMSKSKRFDKSKENAIIVRKLITSKGIILRERTMMILSMLWFP